VSSAAQHPPRGRGGRGTRVPVEVARRSTTDDRQGFDGWRYNLDGIVLTSWRVARSVMPGSSATLDVLTARSEHQDEKRRFSAAIRIFQNSVAEFWVSMVVDEADQEELNEAELLWWWDCDD
jgi:hypothetical protein